MARASRTASYPRSPARRVLTTIVVLAAMRTEHSPWSLLARFGLIRRAPVSSSPIGPVGASAASWSAVHTGIRFVCARTDLGRVKCWGDAAWGQLGTGDTSARGDSPDELGSALPYLDFGSSRTATEISVGGYHSCAILSDNSLVWCEARAHRGAGWMGGCLPSRIASDLAPRPRHASRVACAPVCCRRSRRLLRGGPNACLRARACSCSWGQGSDGRIGTGSEEHVGDDAAEMGDALVAVSLGTGLTAKTVSCGLVSTCVIVLQSNRLKCFGGNEQASLGLGDTIARAQPSQLGDALPYVDLGLTQPNPTVEPQPVLKLSSRSQHVCVVLLEGLKWYVAGVRVDALARGGSARHSHGVLTRACAALSPPPSRAMRSFGANANGQLGYADTATRGASSAEMGDSLPWVDLAVLATQIIDVSVSEEHSCALVVGGRLKCWCVRTLTPTRARASLRACGQPARLALGWASRVCARPGARHHAARIPSRAQGAKRQRPVGLRRHRRPRRECASGGLPAADRARYGCGHPRACRRQPQHMRAAQQRRDQMVRARARARKRGSHARGILGACTRARGAALNPRCARAPARCVPGPPAAGVATLTGSLVRRTRAGAAPAPARWATRSRPSLSARAAPRAA